MLIVTVQVITIQPNKIYIYIGKKQKMEYTQPFVLNTMHFFT